MSNWQSCSTEARCGTEDNGSQKDHYIRIMAGEKTWQSQTELKTLRDVNSREDFLRASRYVTSPHACGRSVSSLSQLDTVLPKLFNFCSNQCQTLPLGVSKDVPLASDVLTQPDEYS